MIDCTSMGKSALQVSVQQPIVEIISCQPHIKDTVLAGVVKGVGVNYSD